MCTRTYHLMSVLFRMADNAMDVATPSIRKFYAAEKRIPDKFAVQRKY